MPMKSPSERSAQYALVNILVFPGLGSLKAGRWVAGIGQVCLVTAGSGMLLLWLYKVLSQYYGQMFGDVKPEACGWIGVTGGVLFCISWLWAGVTSLSLFREAAKPRPSPPPVLAARAPGQSEVPKAPYIRAVKLDEAGILSAQATSPLWGRTGDVIARTFEFADFVVAMKFVNAVAEIAEATQHHPDIDIRWNKVTLALTTHDAGGLTEKDFALARQCDALAAGAA
jgi:4a-hydroxytetrahydrobiopterin dehydratase